MIGFIIWLLMAYIVGQMVYIYNSDVKIKAKCKSKSWSDTIAILWWVVWEKHKSRYRWSDLEDVVDEVKETTVDFAKQAKTQMNDVVEDIKQESAKVVNKAKSEVKKATTRNTSSKKSNTKKTTSQTQKASAKAKTVAKKKG